MNYYPRGKLNNDDEGELAIAIGVEDKTVIIDFGKDITWVGMDKFQAIQFATAILKHANSIHTEKVN